MSQQANKKTEARRELERLAELALLIVGMSTGLSGCFDSANSAVPTADELGATDFCSITTVKALEACESDVTEEMLIAEAVCVNIADDAERADCEAEVVAATDEAATECLAVAEARDSVCTLLGETRYDPVIDPADFVDPLQVGASVTPNRFLPLVPGNVWEYESPDGTVTVTVLEETIVIGGVTAIIVRDVEVEGGEVVESTDDYFAQDLSGNVWYFGETVQNFEDGVLTDLDGSFRHGIDGAKAGLLVPADPQIGAAYRQEWAIAEAEDLAEVLSLTASESTPGASCNGTCLQTREFTPLEPEVEENKFYVENVGVIVAFDVAEPDEREELIRFTPAP